MVIKINTILKKETLFFNITYTYKCKHFVNLYSLLIWSCLSLKLWFKCQEEYINDFSHKWNAIKDGQRMLNNDQ